MLGIGEAVQTYVCIGKTWLAPFLGAKLQPAVRRSAPCLIYPFSYSSLCPSFQCTSTVRPDCTQPPLHPLYGLDTISCMGQHRCTCISLWSWVHHQACHVYLSQGSPSYEHRVSLTKFALNRVELTCAKHSSPYCRPALFVLRIQA